MRGVVALSLATYAFCIYLEDLSMQQHVKRKICVELRSLKWKNYTNPLTHAAVLRCE